MKIAIIGYGRMGKAIEKIAVERGNEIVLKIDDTNIDEFTIANLQKADVAIEFTRPEFAHANISKCIEAKVPVVSGTTGWLDKWDETVQSVKQNKAGLFYASNYSVGVNIFFELNKQLAKLMNPHKEYDVSMVEIHHTQKLDAPSGTAITLAEGVFENISEKNTWVNEKATKSEDIGIISERIEGVPGTHSIHFDSEIDSIEIKHTAHSRKGFATGAVLAAEFMVGKEGVYGMSDMLGL